MTGSNRGGPLQGVRVVELTKVWAGPYVGKLLAFLGAEVIRVESEGSMDVTRTYGVDDINNAPGFQAVNPQKLSVQINMKSEEGLGLLRDLLAESHVLVENLRPGATKRLGLDYERVKAINPGLVYVSMGMYGKEGPLAYQTGYAPCFAALGGVSALVGYPGEAPAGMNVRYADSSFAASATYAAVAALLHSRRGGGGQFIDVSAVESMTSMVGDTFMDYALNGVTHESEGNRHPEMAPHGVYPCRDGEWLSLAASSDAAWQALARAMGRPELADDPAFRTLSDRKANEDELDSLLAQWTSGQEAQALSDKLQRDGIAAAKSRNSLDMISDAQLWSRGFYREVAGPDGQSRPVLGPSWRMSREAELTHAAPRLGEHNAYVLGEVLGLSADEQQRLAESGAAR